MKLSSICQTFAYDSRNYLMQATCILAPVAIEIMDFSFKCYNDPGLLQRKWINIKDSVLHTFIPRPSESLEGFTKRSCHKFIKTALIVAAVSVTIWAFMQLMPIVMTSFKIKSIWSLYELLPHQTNLVVKLEYFSMGLAHGYIALQKLKAGNNCGGMFHLCAAISAVAFPYIHLAQGEELRLHHSLLGPALQPLRVKTLKTTGTYISIDSTLYSFAPQRGYFDCFGNFMSYDYMNVIVDKFPSVIQSVVAVSALEAITE